MAGRDLHMKARLIMDQRGKLLLLCEDGTIASATKVVRYNLLTNFKRQDDFFTGTAGRWDREYPDMTVYPGREIAILTDNYSLVINDFQPFESLLNAEIISPDYLSVADFAKRHDKSQEIIKVYCRKGRIFGAKKIGTRWMIPEDAEYPIEPERQREGVRGPRGSYKKKGK